MADFWPGNKGREFQTEPLPTTDLLTQILAGFIGMKATEKIVMRS
jgi:hypothetical protein